ncbi:MAG: carboxypeptidase-like regulatory domain-containing protein, partial [Bryobacteraceae bacterium]|nr:carboxypeptidase-like regulatory domain-containing protein [Bryobacteraceae bacterium]
MKGRRIQGLMLTLVLFLFAAPVLAQDTANLTGTVTDPTGAVVVGAQVTVTNVATNVETTTETNSEGIYRVPFLRPGTYRVTISAAGFKRFIRENVTLSVGATVPVNASLEIGTVADTVEVRAAIPLLETETSATGTLVKGDYFYRMPLYQRWSRSILYLTPGVNVSGFGWGGDLGGFQINGNASGEIGFFEDGIFGVRPGATMTTETIQNTIDEIKVLTTALPAEFGHSAGGAIVIVKKSGTNQLHGLVSELFRERPMQHRRFFQRERFEQVGTTLHFHMPDANMSGPVYIPKIYDGRNRTFFMVAGQWLIERQGETVTYSVPTAEMLNGDFSFGGRAGVNAIYDPRTTRLENGQWFRYPYAGNIIPKSMWDPVATKFLSRNVWTKPNLTGTPTATGFSDNLIATRQKTVDFYTYSARVDHQMTQSLKTFWTWNYNMRTSWTPDMSIQDPLFDASSRTSVDAQTVTGIGATWTLSPTLISESRASYYRSKVDATWPGFGTDYGTLLGIPNIGKGSMPNITGIPYVSNPSMDVREILSFKEDVSKLVGKHAFKTGYEIMRFRRNSYSITNNAGTFNLASTNGLQPNGSAIPNTGGHSLTQLMTGAVSSATFTVNLLSTLPRNWMHSLYFQDDWKIRPSLTLNLGLRWQVQSVMNNKYGQQSSFDPNAPDNVVTGAKGVITHPAKLHNKDWNN